jgi:hypothetical protein
VLSWPAGKIVSTFMIKEECERDCVYEVVQPKRKESDCDMVSIMTSTQGVEGVEGWWAREVKDREGYRGKVEIEDSL